MNTVSSSSTLNQYNDLTQVIHTIKRVIPHKNLNETVKILKNRAIIIGGATVLPPTKEAKKRQLAKRFEDSQKHQRFNKSCRNKLYRESLQLIKVSSTSSLCI